MFKQIISTFIGSFLAMGALLLTTIILTYFLFSSYINLKGSTTTPVVLEESVLMLNLGEIALVEKEDQFNNWFVGSEFFEDYRHLQVRDLIKMINHARDDKNISGIFLNLSGYYLGWGSTEEIRAALEEYTLSGGKITAYSENFDEKSYYLASIAQRISMYPEGEFELNGLSIQPLFMKKLLAKLNIEPRVFRAGKFKGAVEPYIRENLSKENRQQETQLLGDIWDTFYNTIFANRKIYIEDFNEQVQNGYHLNSGGALALSLIDSISEQNETLSKSPFKTKNKTSVWSYLPQVKSDESTLLADDTVAILTINGEITSGKSLDQSSTGSTSILAAIERIEKDDNVKALVVRVNSPGGSALASDVIYRRLKQLAQKMPIVSSMGDVAASGGYYIAVAGSKIFANETTITGSIGVFGLLFGYGKFSEQSLGITADRVVTHPFADLGNGFRKLDPKEQKIIQSSVGQVYESFLTVVAENREISKEVLKTKLAGGRVWTGKTAKGEKLIDQIGGLTDAIEEVAFLAQLPESYKVVDFTTPKRDLNFSIAASFMKSLNKGPLDNLSTEINRLMRWQTQKNKVFTLMTPLELDIH